jgi:hypothetical protein
VSNYIKVFTKQREEFLQRIADTLSADERFEAAWLTGSFARRQQDAMSDIDITLVVSDEHARALCARPWQVSAQTTKERYDLFCLFGLPSIIHENNNNAPDGGTFTFVAYAQTAIMVDWVLRSLTAVQRPEGTFLLFDKVGIPIQAPAEPESLEQRAREASEITAFFWMMAAVTVKYIYRGDDVFVNTWLEELMKLVQEVDRRIQGRAWEYKRGSSTVLRVTAEDQIDFIRQLCERMEKLIPGVKGLGGYGSESPMSTIELLVRLVQEKS